MILRREPVLIQIFFVVTMNLLTAFGVLGLSCAQANALTAALAAVLGLVTRRLVTPLNDPRDAYLRQLAVLEQQQRKPDGTGS